jgi:hypothetical protein
MKTEAGKQYSTAYNVQYTEKDMHKAFELYKCIIAEHPNTEEAGYSESQIQNIVNAVVPKQKVVDALMDLALTQFGHAVPPKVELASDTQLAPN